MGIFLYYWVCLVVLYFATPLLLFKAKARAGIFQKLGFVPRAFKPKPDSVWFHAVSVGEFNAVKTLLEDFHRAHPELDVVVSTTTATGQAIARDTVGSWASVVYMPFDLPWTVNAWLKRARPQMLVIAETEIWPGLVYQCRKRDIKVVAVNGRLSPRSFRTYSRFWSFFSWVFSNYTAFGVQSDSEAERYRLLLGPDSRVPVRVLGNLKLDGMQPADAVEIAKLRNRLNLSKQQQVLIAGSTHEGEESALVSIYQKLKGKFPDLKLIVVPRHPERFDRVEEIFKAFGLSYSRYSQAETANLAENDALLVDTMGQLSKLYSVSDIAFVGGTIAKIGGHNLIEPYLYRVPVVSGPEVFKIKDTANQLVQMNAAFVVQDEAELGEKIDYLLLHDSQRLAMGQCGYVYLQANLGATKRALEFLDSTIGGVPRQASAANERKTSEMPTDANGPQSNSPNSPTPLNKNRHRTESKLI